MERERDGLLFHVLTELSSPRVRSIMKKMSDQKVDAGRVAMASGYTTNTRPGPETSHCSHQGRHSEFWDCQNIPLVNIMIQR